MRILFSRWECGMLVCAWLCGRLCCLYVWPQEELPLACAGGTTVGAAALVLNTEGFCVWGENQRLWFNVPKASSLSPLPLFLCRPLCLSLSLLRLEFVSLPPFSSQSGKNKSRQFIRLSHYISPPAWPGWVRVCDWHILQVSSSRSIIMASLCPALKCVVPEPHEGFC